MDGVTVNGRTGRLWLCRRENGHALGLLMEVCEDGFFFERLWVFREAVMPQAVEFARPLVFLDATTLDIPCSLCEAKRTWWMGNGARKRALKMYVAE